MSEKAERFGKLAGKKSKEESKSKDAKKTLLTGKDTLTTSETNTHAIPETNKNKNTETQDVKNENPILNKKEETIVEVKEEVKEETKSENKTDVNQFNDPALELINVVASGKKKKKLEDERIRSTYWLKEAERDMVNKLAKETGYTKYDVVGMAIRSMYERVMQVKPEKKTKKPDQR